MDVYRDLAIKLCGVLLAVGCGSTSGSAKPAQTAAVDGANTTFVSTWKSPTAKPLKLEGSRIAVAVIMSDMASRRTAEDALAKEISARGGIGLPMYTLVEQPSVVDEPIAREALEKAAVRGVVVLHPNAAESEYVTANQKYGEAPYNSYWDGYYNYGLNAPWEPAPVTQAFIRVETLIYSLAQNQLVWVSQSKTTNPSTLDKLMAEVVAATATELSRASLLAR